jgi:mono/diheme cytochrome c family protein
MKKPIVAALATAVGIVAFYAAARAQPSRSVWDGVYTEAQAKRGAALFDEECASCHGAAGVGGGMAPALVGAAFAANYDGLTVDDLFERNRTTMPVDREGRLSRQQTADITAFLLECNKFPTGEKELPVLAAELKQIQYAVERPRDR